MELLATLSTCPPYRTADGFTFHFVPDVGWTDGDMVWPTFASLLLGWG